MQEISAGMEANDGFMDAQETMSEEGTVDAVGPEMEGSSAEEADVEASGFDGTWDFEWVGALDSFMEEFPWTWIAVAVFTAGMVYSYVKNRKSD